MALRSCGSQLTKQASSAGAYAHSTRSLCVGPTRADCAPVKREPMSFHSQPKARRAGTLGSLSALFAVLSLAAGCGGHASAVPSLPLGPLSLDGRDARTIG